MLNEIKEILPLKCFIDNFVHNYPLAKYLSNEFYKCINDVINDDRIATTFSIIDAYRDRLWEQINTGHFSKVCKIDRQFYGLMTLYKTVLRIIREINETEIHTETIENIIWDLDNAILLGCPLDEPKYENILSDCLNILQKYSSHKNENYPTMNSIELVVRNTPDKENDVIMLTKPSIEDFSCNYFQKTKPVILTNCMEHWPAMKNWCNPNYLINVAKNRIIPIEVGNNYTKENWSQDLVKFQDFFRRQFFSDETKGESSVEYLAQHNLFDQIPRLKQDIIVPEYCCISNQSETDIDIKAWLGPKGTVSPMHHDPKHNLLCQIFGHKKIILAAPDDSKNLYPHENNLLGNTSQIDAENLNIEKFPLSKNVKFYHLTLYSGEMLYIPPKWWHHVHSLSKSFSVSFWWD